MKVKPIYIIKQLIVTLFFISPSIINSQTTTTITTVITPDLINGTWQGVLIQKANEFTDNYAYWVSFTMKNDSVFGVVRTEDANTPYYAIVSIRGKVINNTISFTQDKIMVENRRPESYWCLIKGELVYDAVDNSLSGKWISDMERCEAGSMIIYKTPKQINMGATNAYAYLNFNEIDAIIKSKKKFVGYKVRLSEINFETNSYKIVGNTANNEADRINALIKKNEILHVNIQGHTDNTGADDFNLRLSYYRAKEIYNLLLAKGVKEDRISYEGYGKSRPIATNLTEEGKLQNRRVEIELYMVPK